MDTIEIRTIDIAANYDLVSAMMRGLHENEKELNPQTADWDEIETSYMRHCITMQEDCEGICLVAYVNNVPAGFIFGYIEEDDDSRFELYTGRVLYVADGYVAPDSRRMGIYRMLNSKLEGHFTATGVRRITRMTMVNNTGMRGLLEQDGYVATRILYEKWL